MSNQPNQIAHSIASEISSIESRERKRSSDAQKHFEHAVECLLKDLWLGTAIHPEYEVGIHRRSNWYSETPQYRDPNLTFIQAIAAYFQRRGYWSRFSLRFGFLYESGGGYWGLGSCALDLGCGIDGGGGG